MEKHYSIEEVFNLIGEENIEGDVSNHQNRKTIIVDGFKVYTKSTRYMTFFQNGLKCACCGKEGAYFKLDGDENSDRRHFNLYCDDGTLMTKDHIVPKSRGGVDRVSNMQTMCMQCNVAKGNLISGEQRYTVRSTDADGKTKDYQSVEEAVLLILNGNGFSLKKRKSLLRGIEKIIEVTDNIRYAIDNRTTYRNKYWEIINNK